MKGFLLDTIVPSGLTRARSAPQVERWLNAAEHQQLFFTVISLAEICKGIAKLPESRKRAQLQDWLDSVLRPWFAGRILPITEAIAERMGRWAGENEAVGRVMKIADGDLDAQIVAIAFSRDTSVAVRDVRAWAGLRS